MTLPQESGRNADAQQGQGQGRARQGRADRQATRQGHRTQDKEGQGWPKAGPGIVGA